VSAVPSWARSSGPAGDRNLAYLLALPAAVLLLSLAVYPFLRAAFDSLFHVELFTRARTFAGLDNYTSLVQDGPVHDALGRTLVWTVTNVGVQTLLGVAIALLLNARLRGQTLARGLLLFPYMVPSIVVALVFRFMFNDVTGVVNYVLLATHLTSGPLDWLSSPDSALWTAIAVNCWKYTPFMIIVVLGRLQTVPPELYDAGRIDGATRGALFRYVTLPWLLPVLLIAMLLRTIWTATDFDLLFLLAFGGPVSSTTTVPLLIRSLAFNQQDVGLASALAIFGAAVLSVAAWLYLRAYRRSEAQLQ